MSTNLNELKLITATIIKESKLDKNSKLQLINFVQETKEPAQLKSIIMDGTIVKNLTEQTKQIINDRFDASNLLEAGLRKTAMSVAGLLIGTPLWVAWRELTGLYGRCSKGCGTFAINTAKRQMCIMTCKMNDLNKRMQIGMKIDCKSTKDPQKCEESKRAGIEKIKAQMTALKAKMNAVGAKGKF